MFGLTLNVAAGLGSVASGWLDDWLGSRRMIVLALAGLIIAGAAAASVQTRPWLWLTGGFLGFSSARCRPLAESLMARLAPATGRPSTSGCFALSSKVTSFVGPDYRGRRYRCHRQPGIGPRDHPCLSGGGFRSCWQAADETAMVDPVDQALVRIARDLAHELWPGRRAVDRAGLDSSLDRDWGFDSLSRAELLLARRAGVRHASAGAAAGRGRDTARSSDSARRGKGPRRSPVELAPVRPQPDAAEPAPPTAATITEVLDWHAEPPW